MTSFIVISILKMILRIEEHGAQGRSAEVRLEAATGIPCAVSRAHILLILHYR